MFSKGFFLFIFYALTAWHTNQYGIATQYSDKATPAHIRKPHCWVEKPLCVLLEEILRP